MESNSHSEDSVTEWIVELKKGDQQSAQKIFDRYMSRLVRIASKRLGSTRRRSGDEEDVVSIAFTRFLEKVDTDGFYKLDDRDDLWQILFTLTDRKAIDMIRHESAQIRGGDSLVGESVFEIVGKESSSSPGIGSLDNGEPTAEYAAILTEQFSERLATLTEEQQEIAVDKMEGMSNPEIAEKRGVSLRTIERRLHEIRRLWEPGSH